MNGNHYSMVQLDLVIQLMNESRKQNYVLDFHHKTQFSLISSSLEEGASQFVCVCLSMFVEQGCTWVLYNTSGSLVQWHGLDAAQGSML